MGIKSKQSDEYKLLEIRVDVPKNLDKEMRHLSGEIYLIGKINSTIEKVCINIKQMVRRETFVGRVISERTIGKFTFEEIFNIQSNEILKIPFRIDFERNLSLQRRLLEENGLQRILGQILRQILNEEWQFLVEGEVYIKGIDSEHIGSTEVWFT